MMTGRLGPGSYSVALVSPYLDRERKREFARRWMNERRATWLADHPCACGRPAVTMRGEDGPIPKGIFSASEKRREDLLRNVRTFCENHAPRPKKPASPHPSKVGAEVADEPATTPILVFSIFQCEECDAVFERLSPLVRHVRSRHNREALPRERGLAEALS